MCSEDDVFWLLSVQSTDRSSFLKLWTMEVTHRRQGQEAKQELLPQGVLLVEAWLAQRYCTERHAPLLADVFLVAQWGEAGML